MYQLYLQHDATPTFLGADGFVNTNVTASQIDMADGFQQNCIFELQPQRFYSVAKEITKKVTKLGLTVDEVLNDSNLRDANHDGIEQLLALCKREDREVQHNAELLNECCGRGIGFGQEIIQLKHVASGKYLCAGPGLDPGTFGSSSSTLSCHAALLTQRSGVRGPPHQRAQCRGRRQSRRPPPSCAHARA